MKKHLLTIAALFGVFMGGAVVAQVSLGDPGKVKNNYILDGDLVRSGGIIKTITMSVTNSHDFNAQQCQKTCDADGNCNAFGYEHTSQNRKPECLLRMTALPGGARRNHGYLTAASATKVSFVENDLQMNVTSGQAIQGGQSTNLNIPNNDPMACIDACWRDRSCKGVTFFPKGFYKRSNGAVCGKFTQLGQITYRRPVPGVLTAIKAGGANIPVVKKPVTKPRPIIKPKPKPVLTPRKKNPAIVPDKTERDENPTLSDDDEFPGEMLDPQT